MSYRAGPQRGSNVKKDKTGNPLERFLRESKQFIDLERKAEVESTEEVLKSVPKKELERRGVVLTRLIVEEVRTGLYGRTIVSMVRRPNGSDSTPELPANRFGPGDIVALVLDGSSGSKRAKSHSKDDDEEEPDSFSALVYRISSVRVQLALNVPLNLDYSDKSFTLQLLANDVTFRRMEKATETLEAVATRVAGLSSSSDASTEFVPTALKVVFGIASNEVDPDIQEREIIPFNSGLNASQLEAIRFALAAKHVALIHGPPGTGKTTTVVEFINQAVRFHGKKILACAPSNVAVDSIPLLVIVQTAPRQNFTDLNFVFISRFADMVEKIAASGSKIKIVRLGHPARILPGALNYIIDDVYRDSNAFEVVKGMVEDMDKLQKEINRTRSFAERRAKRAEWTQIRRELKTREITGIEQIIKDADVVLCTCTGAQDKYLKKRSDLFDIAVIDEAGQGVDQLVLIPMLRAKKIILAGDHLQLPPTIKSTEATSLDLGTTTFFERMIKRERRYERERSEGQHRVWSDTIGASGVETSLIKSERRDPGRLSAMLTVQYRMNDLIMKYSSSTLYESRLTSHESVAHHRLIDSKRMRFGEQATQDEYSVNPIILVDTAGLDLAEIGGEQESKYNEGEADIVCALVEKLISWEGGPQLDPRDVGVISPYNAQVELLREKLRQKWPHLEINSVDSFQGREKEAIVMSLVRSNTEHDVGFLRSDQRTNVAITRARKCLLLVTDTETTSSHPFLKHLFEFIEEKGEVWSGATFLPETRHFTPSTKSAAENPTPGLEFLSKKERARIERQQEREKELAEKKKRAAERAEQEKEAKLTQMLQEEIRKQENHIEDQANEEAKAAGEDLAKQADSTFASLVRVEEIDEAEAKAAFEQKPSQPALAPAPAGPSSSSAAAPPAQYVDQLAEYRKQMAAQRQQAKETGGSASSTSAGKAPAPAAAKVTGGSGKVGGAKKPAPPPQTRPKQAANEKDKAFKAAQTDDEIFDALLSQKNTCHFSNCKESVKLIYSDCHYCRERFCMKHAVAEVHGCADRARAAARQDAVSKAKEMKSLGSLSPHGSSPKLKDWQRDNLSARLQKKVEDQKQQRTKQPPKGKK